MNGELKLVVDSLWAVKHPKQAKAIYRKHIRRHLGLDNRRGDSVLQLKLEPKPKRTPKPKRKTIPKRKKVKLVYTPPLTSEGVPMVKTTELGPRLGYGRYSLRNLIVRGHIQAVVQQEWEGGRRHQFVSEAEVRDYLATRTETRGRKRKQR